MATSKKYTPGKRIGQGMLITTFVFSLIALTIFFDNLLSNQSNPNQSPDYSLSESGIREVILQRNRQGHYVAIGRINGIPVTFLLDTGATDVAIPSNVAKEVGLERGIAHRALTANGIVTVFATTVGELNIGNITLYDIDASITPSMPGDTILLGMSALKKIEFTQKGASLTLRHLP